jgi:hypothetical protein
MVSQAKVRPVDDTKQALVYTGHLTKLIMGPPLNLPMPYYTPITKALQGMGCAQQIKRGGGSAPSRWVLYEAPTRELYTKWEKVQSESLTAQAVTSKTALVEQQVRDLTSRVEALEASYTELITAIGE